MIKNAITYSVIMPRTASEMLDFIVNNGVMSREPGTQEIRTFGFAHHPVTHEVVSELPNGYCITFRVWNKNIKASIVRRLVEKRIAESGYTPKKAEREQIRDDVISELVLKIPAESETYHAYYDANNQTLIVDSCRQKAADSITSLLRKTIGSLKATTLYIDSTNGLTQNLAQYLKDHNEESHILDFVSGLSIGNTIVLKSSQGESVTYKNMDLLSTETSGEIVGLILENHMTVQQLQLNLTGTFSFVLTDGFKLKRLEYPEYDSSDHPRGSLEEWEADSWYATQQISLVMKLLSEKFTVVEDTPTPPVAPSIPVPPGV